MSTETESLFIPKDLTIREPGKKRATRFFKKFVPEEAELTPNTVMETGIAVENALSRLLCNERRIEDIELLLKGYKTKEEEHILRKMIGRQGNDYDRQELQGQLEYVRRCNSSLIMEKGDFTW